MDFLAPDHKIAGTLASRIALRDVSFGMVEAKLLGPMSSSVLSYRTPKMRVQWSRSDRDISALFPFLLIAECKQEGSDEHLVDDVAHVSIIMRLEYKLLEHAGDISDEQLPHVIGTLGYMHAWPYFRADVQWLTTKLGFPALVLPVVLSGEVAGRLEIARVPIPVDDHAPPESDNNAPTLLPSQNAAAQPLAKRQTAPKPRRKPKVVHGKS